MMISNSFGLKADAKSFIHIDTLNDLSALDSIDNKRLLILGAGTNVLLSNYFDGTVLAVRFKDIEINDDFISVGAGVYWADLIEYCLANRLYGIENLTHIPGSVGAAPVQNIGAYGVELKDVFLSCEVFNTNDFSIKTYNLQQCKFEYRNSIFKENKNLIILSIRLKLKNKNHKMTNLRIGKMYMKINEFKKGLQYIQKGTGFIRFSDEGFKII